MSESSHEASIILPSRPSQIQRDQIRWMTIGRIAGRQVMRFLSGWPFYGATFVALVVVTGLLYCTVRFVAQSGVYVLTRPFVLPMQLVTTIGLLYVLFTAALSQVIPYDQGGQHSVRLPVRSAAVDMPVRATARLLTGVAIYGLLLLILIPPLALVTWDSNLVIPPALLWGLAPTLLSAALAASFGLFIAVVAQSRETAVAIGVLVVVTTLMLQTSDLILASLPPASPYQPLLSLLHTGRQLLPYISPFAAADAMLDAALRSDVPALLRFALVTLFNTTLWLTVTHLSRRQRERLP